MTATPRRSAARDRRRGDPFRAIAEAIGERLGLPAVSLSPEEAAGHFEWPDFFAGADLPASGTLTAERFGRHPERPGLLADLAAGQCFRIPA
ncbi:hypothetical protein ACWDUL_38680 [Nocardia niigatensis]